VTRHRANITGHVAAGQARAMAVSALLMLGLLSGCSSDQVSFVPAPPSRPPLQASAGDQAAAREHQRLLALFGGEYNAPAAKRLMDDVVARIARVAPQPAVNYEVTLLNSATPNAFALPNGHLYVTRGLLVLVNDTSEIAAVLAHEMSHVIARHASDRAEVQLRSALFTKVAANMVGDRAAEQNVKDRTRIDIATFSRQQELEADRIGVGLLGRAKFDPYGAQRFLTSLGKASILRGQAGESGRGRALDMLSSHPSTPERIAQVQSAARQIAAPGIGEQDRDKWLGAVDGVAFGDDPATGIVRGRRYLNTSLGISLQVPPPLSLDAGREAVIGVSPDGQLAFRFDVVTLDQGQSLTSYINSRWIDGVTVADVQQVTLAGNPAVTASGKGSDWSFRMAAVQNGQLTFRFILAANAGAGDLERNFRSIIENFRSLPADEARTTVPQRIRLVTAGGSDTAETLAGQMATEGQSLGAFQALNGLERGSQIVPGKRYKVVTN
jgi:predicted Zn-dependent protease